MAGLFRSRTALSQESQKLSGIRVQSSIYGVCRPVVYGTNRLNPNLIWYGDFVASKVQSTGSKGGLFGGSKGSQTNFTYAAAVALGLCEGPILNIGRVWDSLGNLPVNIAQESFTIPGGGGSYTVAHNSNFFQDQGVQREDAYSVNVNDYGSPGTVTLAGTQLTQMNLGSGTGFYSQSGGTYNFSSGDAGKTVLINYTYTTPNTNDSGQPTIQLNFTTFVGSRPQGAWGYLGTNHPSQAIGYTGLAYVASPNMDLGSSGVVPNLGFEIFGRQTATVIPNAGGLDNDPSAVIQDMLTDPHYGLGASGVAPGIVSANFADWSNYAAYCLANGIYISPVFDQQRPCSDWLHDILKATNAEAFWSGAQLKVVSYGDTSAVGNGTQFTPNTAPIYDLDDDDFIQEGDADPIIVTRPSLIEATNSIQIEFSNRANSYNPEIVEARDQNAVQQYGLRPGSPEQMHFVTSQPVAALVAQTLLTRSVYVRNTYAWTGSARYILLEPMDIVTLTDSLLGLNKQPVRIKSVEEAENNRIKFTAEEFPWSTSAPTLYPKQAVSPGSQNADSPPGLVNTPIIFETLSRLNNQIGHALWIGLSGSDANWGGCGIWVSLDGGTTYSRVGEQLGASRMGVTTSDLASHSDPDLADTFGVDLTESFGALASASQTECDNFATMCFVQAPSTTAQVAQDQFSRSIL